MPGSNSLDELSVLFPSFLGILNSLEMFVYPAVKVQLDRMESGHGLRYFFIIIFV